MRALQVTFVFLIAELWAYGSCGFINGQNLVDGYHSNDDNSLSEEARANSWIIHPPPRPMIPLGWYNVVKNGTTMSPMMMMMFGHTTISTTPAPPAVAVAQTLVENVSSQESVLPEATSEASPSLLTETGPASETHSEETIPALESSSPSVAPAAGPAEETVEVVDSGSVDEDKEVSMSASGGESEIEPETTHQPEVVSLILTEPEFLQSPPGNEETAVTSTEVHESEEEEATSPNFSEAGSDELHATTVQSLENVAITLPTEHISEPLSDASSTTELDESSAHTEPNHHNLDATSDNELNENGGESATTESAAETESLYEEQETVATEEEEEEEAKPQGQEQLVTLGQEELLSETDSFTTPALVTPAHDEKLMTTPQTDDADDEATFTTTTTLTRQFQKRALLEAKVAAAVEEEKRDNATESADADLPQARQYLPQRPYPIAPNFMHGGPAYHHPAGYHGYYPDPMVAVARVYEVCYTAWCSVKKSLRRYGLL